MHKSVTKDEMKVRKRVHEYRNGHYVELLQSGEPFFTAVEKIIDEAVSFIHFQSYIVDEDETGIRIVNIYCDFYPETELAGGRIMFDICISLFKFDQDRQKWIYEMI